MRRFLLTQACLAALLASATACMWDRDTLKRDYAEFPTTVEAIVGRIDREPALYYEMRRDRVAKAIASGDQTPELYDDIAVAESRLGHQQSAITWMSKKAKLKLNDDQRYRMYSNLGTFQFLQWLANGKQEKALIEAGIHSIESGLKINPNAHFGREKVQLAFMNWALTVQDPKDSLKEFYDPLSELYETLGGKHLAPEQSALKGLTGLIVLGEVWESPDIMAAVVANLHSGSMRFFAILRAQELIAASHKSIVPAKFESDMTEFDSELYPEYVDGVTAEFHRLRKLADEYRRDRLAFEMPRLKAGRHPDTDPAFWNGWKPAPFRVRETIAFTSEDRFNHAWEITKKVFTIIVSVVILFIISRQIRRLRRVVG